MSTDTIQAIKITDQKAQYDEKAKWLLSRKIFLAYILVETVEEFKNRNPKDVVQYIEGEPYISKVPVDAGRTNGKKDDRQYQGKRLDKAAITYDKRIAGLNTEDTVVNEGSIYYDIIFYVRMKDGLTQIIVNIEAQQKLPGEYHILNRGVFYVCRMVSSQKDREFVKSDYDSIKQVYSIWICMNMPENSMDHFYLADKKIKGNYDWKYDKSLLNIIMLGLSEQLPGLEEDYELHRLLGTMFSKKLSANEKINILEQEYKIEAEKDVKEVVGEMCNLSQGIEEYGIQIGEERGIQIGEERGIQIGEERGIQIGQERGIQIGEERGLQIGEERGLQIGERRTILNMEQAGFSIEQIMLATKCSIERIRKVIGESKEEKARYQCER